MPMMPSLLLISLTGSTGNCARNSYKRKELGDKSPYEMFAFLYGEKILKCFGLELFPSDEIILTPALMKL